MRKFKKMIFGMTLAMSIFVGSAGSCYAAARATSNITIDVTKTRIVGKFEYGEAGHQIKVVVNYLEQDSKGYFRDGSASDTQFGNVTTAYVSRPNTEGYQYISGYALGYVDGVKKAISGEAYA